MSALENASAERHDSTVRKQEEREPYRYAARVFDLVERHKTPPIPAIYALWYAYVSRANPELVRRIDEMLKNNEPFEKAKLEEIFRSTNFEEQQREERNQIAIAFEGEVHSALQMIEECASTSNQFSGRLTNFAQELPKIESTTQLQSVVNGLVQENRKMASLTQDLSEGLKQSMRHVERLKGQLVELQRRCAIDPLTGIANRRAFDERLNEELTNALAFNSGLCLVLADLDHFKRVNDDYGHQVGDAALCLFANLAQRSIKGDDFVARYGGEEFAIILPSTSLFAAHNLMIKLKSRFREAVLDTELAGARINGLTASFGVAGLRSDMSATALISEADTQLYRAKKAGRNCVMTAGVY